LRISSGELRRPNASLPLRQRQLQPPTRPFSALARHRTLNDCRIVSQKLHSA
jgi:hypothetical protein